MTMGLWDRETFVEKLQAIGVRAYHDKHLFHVAMNEGQLSPEALRGWVTNRFYYQRNIPIKDAAILANCPVRTRSATGLDSSHSRSRWRSYKEGRSPVRPIGRNFDGWEAAAP